MQKYKRQSPPKILVDESYFKEARHWFTEIYIAPIPSRSFFVILCTISLIIMTVAVLAMIQLMPIYGGLTLTVENSAIDETATDLTRLRTAGMGLNTALKRFMVGQYVKVREEYKFDTWGGRSAFIRAHSDELMAAADETASSETNPDSYRATLGQVGERLVTIEDVHLMPSPEDPSAPREAVVRFTVQYRKVLNLPESSWTATLRFYYSNIKVTEAGTPDKISGKLATSLPLFKVVSYEVVQNP